jgi:hypothetical protein
VSRSNAFVDSDFEDYSLAVGIHVQIVAGLETLYYLVDRAESAFSELVFGIEVLRRMFENMVREYRRSSFDVLDI